MEFAHRQASVRAIPSFKYRFIVVLLLGIGTLAACRQRSSHGEGKEGGRLGCPKPLVVRKVTIAFCLLILSVLSGCSSEKGDIISFLNALEESNTRMNEQLHPLMVKMSQMKNADFNSEEAQKVAAQVKEQFQKEKQRLAALTPPPKASSLKDKTVESLGLSLEQLDLVNKMFGIHGDLSEIQKKVEASPKDAPALEKEAQKVMADWQALQAEMGEHRQKQSDLESEIQKEREALMGQYGVSVQAESAPATSATP